MSEVTEVITTLTGNNSFLLKAELARRIAGFVKSNGDMALEKVDGEEVEFSRITEAIQNLPFLANKKLVVLRSPAAHKEFTEKFEALLETIPETNDVIIVEPKPDKRSGYYKLLKNKTDLKEFGELDGNGLARWLVTSAKQAGGGLSLSDARYLVERAGANQQMLYMELQKLLTYDPEVTRRTIDELTESTPQSTVFQLLDAAFSANKKRIVELYQEQRALAVEPMEIMSMLAWQLHILALVKTAGDRSPAQIAREAGISPFVAGKTANIARKHALADIKRLTGDLSRLDIRLKSEPIDADEALLNYLLTINETKTLSTR